MVTVTASFNTTVRQITETSQRKKNNSRERVSVQWRIQPKI